MSRRFLQSRGVTISLQVPSRWVAPIIGGTHVSYTRSSSRSRKSSRSFGIAATAAPLQRHKTRNTTTGNTWTASFPCNYNTIRFSTVSRRPFHATTKQEILPIIAGLGIVLIGRYSWKALQRMDHEWEDYLWELQQFERQRLNNISSNEDMLTTTIGIDIGTFYLKLSRMSNGNQPQLVETTQGDRYRFNGILLEDHGDNNHSMVTGKTALDKFYYPLIKNNNLEDDRPQSINTVILPYMELQNNSRTDAATLVQNVLLPAVSEAMERVSSTTTDNTTTTEANKTFRIVLTLPPIFYKTHGQSFFRNFHDNSHHQTITVPEPVAAIWGARILSILPTPQSKDESTASSTIVIDVGGLTTTISLVREDKIIHHVNLYKIGGEAFVQQLVNHIILTTGDETMMNNTDPMTLRLIHASARSSVLELVNKTQSNIHIPFLYMGRRMNSSKKEETPHFDMVISRTILEQLVQDDWNRNVVPELLQLGALSSSLPPPTGVIALFTSAITKVLEVGKELPTNIDLILLVGGGSKHKLMQEACQEAIVMLMGDSQNKLVLPQPSLRPELTALGAATLLPNFDYDYDKGLERIISLY